MTPIGWLLFAMLLSAKALLVLAAAYGITRLMRNRSAAERHLVWMLASVCVLALPVLSLAGPAWRIAVPASWLSGDAGPSAVPAPAPVFDVSIAPAARRDHVTRALGTPALAPAATATAASAGAWTPPAAAPVQPPVSPPEPDRSVLPLLMLLVWITGTLVVLGRVVIDFARVHTLVRNARPLLDPALLIRAHGVAAELDVRRPLRLLEGDGTAMPITFGILRSTLLLPSSAQGWSAARQDAVLRHELEHVRRRDSLSQLAAELGCALYWFNPLMWWASRRMCVEREHACDDAVLASGSRPSDYAADLLAIARTLRPQRATAVAAIAMARPTHLRTRVVSLLDSRRRERASTKLAVPAWIGAFLVITPLSSLAPDLGGRYGPADPDRTHDAAAAAQGDWTVPDAPEQATKGKKRGSEAPVPLPRPHSSAASLAPVSMSGAAGAQEDCLARGRNTSVNSSSNDSRRTTKWSGSDCSGEVVVEGDIEFDAGFTNITGISRGGQVRITTEEDGTERRVTITPANGGVAYDYRLNGDRREFDAAGQQWLSSTLLFMFRRFGFMADERAAAILERGGPSALLAEVGVLTSDFVRASYLTVLIERGRLDEASLSRVLTLAGNTIDSDHYRTRIITAVAGHYDFTDGVRDAYIHAVSDMDSDHYRHEAYSTLLKNGRLNPTQVSSVLGATGTMDSDHYRARLLDELAASYRASPGIRAAYLDAAAHMESDHYKSNVLTNLFSIGGMNSTDLAQVVDAAGTIDSDHYRALVLGHVAQQGLSDVALQRAFVRAAGGIDSDHYLQSVLAQLAERDDLDNAALLALLEAAEGIGSDHYRSELLVEIAARHHLQGEARTRFERLMENIDSRTWRGRVAEALLKNGRGSQR